MQHADHFTRILNEKESLKREKFSESRTDTYANSTDETNDNPEKEIVDKENHETKISKNTESKEIN